MRITKISSFMIALAPVLAWAGACSTSAVDGDSESHFLATCPPGCPNGLECICGACTRACVTDAVCGALGANATCVTHDACSTPRSCDVKCSGASDCGASGSVCDHGLCRKSESQRDGGPKTHADGATAAHSDASMTPIPDARVPVARPDGHSVPRDGQPQGRCEQPIDTRSCEFGELFVHDPQTNRCKSVGDFRCPNNDNGFASLAECEAACGADGAPGRSPTNIFDWDGGPVFVDGHVATCWLPGAITWSSRFGTHTLVGREYSMTSSAGRSCTAVLPDCGGAGINAHDVGLAVLEVLRAPAPSGQPDAGTLATIDGVYKVGEPCGSTTTCPDGPAKRLSNVLHQIQSQQLGRGDCRPNPDCYLPRDPGPCAGNFQRFAYDSATGVCEPFGYGGCGGNNNRFDTKAACETACDFDPCLFAPLIVPDSGGCNAIFVGGGRCATDPGYACGCACSTAGKDASLCRVSDTTAYCP